MSANPRVSPGERAYLLDLQRKPNYDDGTPRKSWAMLPQFARETWERNPTPREYRRNYKLVSEGDSRE